MVTWNGNECDTRPQPKSANKSFQNKKNKTAVVIIIKTCLMILIFENNLCHLKKMLKNEQNETGIKIALIIRTTLYLYIYP